MKKPLALLLPAFLWLAQALPSEAWLVQAPTSTNVWGTPSNLTTANSGAAHSLTSSAVSVSTNNLIVITGAMNTNTGGDAIIVTDSVGNSYTVYNKNRSTAQTFIAWAIAATPLSSGTVTIADTLTGSTNFSAAAMAVISVSGNATSTVEDTAARNFASIGTATTSPTVTSGTPAHAGDMFFSVYGNSSTNSGAYTEDATNGWTNISSKVGGTTITTSSGYLVNSGTGTKTHNPTTASDPYVQVITAFRLGP